VLGFSRPVLSFSSILVVVGSVRVRHMVFRVFCCSRFSCRRVDFVFHDVSGHPLYLGLNVQGGCLFFCFFVFDLGSLWGRALCRFGVR